VRVIYAILAERAPTTDERRRWGTEMATRKKRGQKRSIEQYDHRNEERINNPPVGLVTPDTDRDEGKKTYACLTSAPVGQIEGFS